MLVPDADPAPALAGLTSAAGFLRGKLGRAIKIRHVPELRFRHDASAAESARISALLDSTHVDDDRG
jgi:ribosome-binding factor A